MRLFDMLKSKCLGELSPTTVILAAGRTVPDVRPRRPVLVAVGLEKERTDEINTV